MLWAVVILVEVLARRMLHAYHAELGLTDRQQGSIDNLSTWLVLSTMMAMITSAAAKVISVEVRELLEDLTAVAVSARKFWNALRGRQGGSS